MANSDEHRPAGELISSLRCQFRQSEFDKVAEILASREESTAAELARLRSAKFTADSSLYFSKITELEQKLKEERDQFFQHGELELAKFDADEQAIKYKRISHLLQEDLDSAAKDLSVLRKWEKRAQDRINWMEEELRRKDQEMVAKFVELKEENQVCKRRKWQAEEEADQWKQKYTVLKALAVEKVLGGRAEDDEQEDDNRRSRRSTLVLPQTRGILASREEATAAELAQLRSAKVTADSSLRFSKIMELEQNLKEERDRFFRLESKHGELELAKFDADEQAIKYKRISHLL